MSKKSDPHIVVYKPYGGLWQVTEYPNEEEAREAYGKLAEKYGVTILAKRVKKYATF